MREEKGICGDTPGPGRGQRPLHPHMHQVKRAEGLALVLRTSLGGGRDLSRSYEDEWFCGLT